MPFHLRVAHFQKADALAKIFEAALPEKRDQLALAGFVGGREHLKHEDAIANAPALKNAAWVFCQEGRGSLAEAMAFFPWVADKLGLSGAKLTYQAMRLQKFGLAHRLFGSAPRADERASGYSNHTTKDQGAKS